MELKNAIVLHNPEKPGDAFQFDDYGVRQDLTCLPDAPSRFEYKEPLLIGPSGLWEYGGEKLRTYSEMFLRVRPGV